MEAYRPSDERFRDLYQKLAKEASDALTTLAEVLTIQRNVRKVAFLLRQGEHLHGGTMLEVGQLVRVNLAGLQVEGVMFQAAVTDAVGHIVKQTSEQPPKYVVKLLFSFRGVSEVEVPAERIHADK